MAQIKNGSDRLLNVAGVDIAPGATVNVSGWNTVKNGDVVKSWVNGGYLIVVSDDDAQQPNPLLPNIETGPVTEERIKAMKVEELRNYLTEKQVPFADEKKEELQALALEAFKG